MQNVRLLGIQTRSRNKLNSQDENSPVENQSSSPISQNEAKNDDSENINVDDPVIQRKWSKGKSNTSKKVNSMKNIIPHT